MSIKSILVWVPVILASIILIYNACIKLSSNPGAIQLFTGLGLEPYGRFAIGILELTAGILLIYPATLKYGAILGTVLMLGVIAVHITKIGIALNGDYSFFIMGVIAFLCCTGLIWITLQKTV